ncbi:MAG: lipase family protein [Bacteroidales bacterium]|jgi:hypothetical protein|nr:lipase family protein [Bacteroidales bacterium]
MKKIKIIGKLKLSGLIVGAMFFTAALISCGSGMSGTYIPKNKTAKRSHFSKFVFQGGTVKVYLGMAGMNIGMAYEIRYKLEGDKLILEGGVPGVNGQSMDFKYDYAKEEISLSLGEEMNEYAPVWGKEGTFDPNAPEETKKEKIPDQSKEKGSNPVSEENKKEAPSDAKTIKGTFTYSGGDIARDIMNDYKTGFCFSTDYFNKNATEYNHDLAIMSLQLAMAAFGLHNEKYGANKADNIVKLLGDMKFEYIEPKGYDKDPTPDSIAVVFAKKNIENDCELLVIAVRGGEYGAEWGGNFNVGIGNVHRGFEIAMYIVEDYFNSYLRKHAVHNSGKKVKLWITGYSRGAAVANLLSAHVVAETTKYNGIYRGKSSLPIPLEKDNIYTYCFATPNNSKNAKYTGYENIYNIISPFDPVPKFPFQSWGFKKYGKEKIFPNPQSDAYAEYKKKMLDTLNELKSDFNESSYLIEDFQVHKGNTGSFKAWDTSLHLAVYDLGPHNEGRGAETMNTYLEHLINVTIFKAMGNQSDYAFNKQSAAIGGAIKPKGTMDVKGFMGAITAEGVMNLGKIAFSGNNNDDIATLGPSDEHLQRLKKGDDNVGALNKSDRTPAVYKFNEGRYDEISKIKGKSIESVVLEAAQKAKNNSYAVTSGHYPELYLAWLQSLPANYFK